MSESISQRKKKNNEEKYYKIIIIPYKYGLTTLLN